MQNILLTTGLVCIIAAIIGGGLSAFDINMPLINSLKRQLLLGSFGIVLFILSFNVGNKEKKTLPDEPTKKNVDKQQVIMNFNQTGNVTVYAGNCTEGMNPGYWWHHLSVVIETTTNDPFYISPSQFRLLVSKKLDEKDPDNFIADTYYRNCHPNMLQEKWIQKGEKITGVLSFLLPEKLKDNTVVNGQAYKRLRYYSQTDTEIIYKPY